MRLASLPSAPFVLYFALWSCGYRCCAAVPTVYVNSSVTAADGSGSDATSHQPEADGHNAVARIKYVAYSVIALVIVALGIVGNLFNLMVLTRPHLKGVMYVYLLGLAASNLCVLVSAIPALLGLSG